MSNRSIAVTNMSDWSAVVFCACKILQLCPVVFCIVTIVLKFYFRLATNEHLTNGDRRKEGNAVIKIHVFLKQPYAPPPPSTRVDSIQAAVCFYHQSKHNILNIVHISATCFGHHQVDITMKWTERKAYSGGLHLMIRCVRVFSDC